MRTYLISYDLAHPELVKHDVANAIMEFGESWARPLDQTWYVRTEETEETVEALLAPLIDTDDGLLIQRVKNDAVLTNTSVRWFKQRRAASSDETNIVAFPAQTGADQTEASEVEFAEAC